MLTFGSLPDAGKGANMGLEMEPTRDRKRVAKGTRNGTETEILLNTNHEESSYATTRKDREDSGLFLGVQVEERETSKPNSKFKPERHDRTRLRKLATQPRVPSLAELPLHFFSGGPSLIITANHHHRQYHIPKTTYFGV